MEQRLRMFPDVIEGDARLADDGMRLLAAASHDLRQPLQAIGLWVELLKDRGADDETQRVLDRIKDTALCAEHVVDGLLDIARLDMGAVAIQAVDFPASDLLEHIASQFGPQARAKGLDLRVRPSSAIIRSDPALLERVLANFASNAIRYTDTGGVMLACRKRGDALSLEVWDTGPGIPEESREVIFREFVQLRGAGRTQTRGVGLGLSIAGRIADLLQHRLRVTSRVGRGSRFTIDVPSGVARVIPLPPQAPDAADQLIRGAFVVYVEDDPAQREAMAALLANWGCHTLIAESMDAALAALDKHLRSPDLVICDYRLDSGPDGRCTFEAIRRHAGTQIPGLILSGEKSEVLRAALAAGGTPLLCKPVPPDVLRRQMAGLLVRPISSVA